jgi:hypothetical protein
VSAQHAGAGDDKGNPVIRDFYNSQLTARSPFSLSYFTSWFHMKDSLWSVTVIVVVKIST